MSTIDAPSPQPVDIARLRELLAKATPEPWEVALHKQPLVAQVTSFEAEVAFDVTKDNAELIAALRNAAPALLDELERLRADCASMREALAFYADVSNFGVTVWGDESKCGRCWQEPAEEHGLQENYKNGVVADFGMKAEDALEANPGASILADRDKLREEVERLSEKVSTIKRAAMEAVGECETWADVLSKGPAIRSERDSLRRENAELKAK